MDHETLERLAADGLSALPGNQLHDLAVWCWDWCEVTGDGRYCSLWRTLDDLDAWLSEHEERGGVPRALAKEIDGLIRSRLGEVLQADSPESGAVLARNLRIEVAERLLPPSEWVSEGWAARPADDS